MIYFAYGSNMHPRQMLRRCPGARPIGPARLDDWRFLITKRGTANIVRAMGERVYGAAWRVEGRHIAHLDRWEGVSWQNYRRCVMRIQMVCGRERTAHVYVSARRLTGTARSGYLHGAVLPGALAFDLPQSYIRELNDWGGRILPIGAVSGYTGRRL